MSVSGIVERKVTRLSSESSVLGALRVMDLHSVGAVPIVDGGFLSGLFTYRDLVHRVLLAGRPLDKTTLGEVMTRNAQSIRSDASCGEALKMMVAGDFTYLPVTDEIGCLEGMLSLRGLLEHQVDDLSQRLDSVVQYFSVDAPGGD